MCAKRALSSSVERTAIQMAGFDNDLRYVLASVVEIDFDAELLKI